MGPQLHCGPLTGWSCVRNGLDADAVVTYRLSITGSLSVTVLIYKSIVATPEVYNNNNGVGGFELDIAQLCTHYNIPQVTRNVF